jgi:hypothetical protein
MTTHEAALVGLRDTLEHLADCRKQLEWTEEAAALTFLTETMLRDLERCQRLLEAMRARARSAKTA